MEYPNLVQVMSLSVVASSSMDPIRNHSSLINMHLSYSTTLAMTSSLVVTFSNPSSLMMNFSTSYLPRANQSNQKVHPHLNLPQHLLHPTLITMFVSSMLRYFRHLMVSLKYPSLFEIILKTSPWA